MSIQRRRLPFTNKVHQWFATKAHMLNRSSIATLMSLKDVQLPNDNNLMDAIKYRGLVGSLQYLTFIRPDIAYVVNCVCQHSQSPTKSNLRVLNWMLHSLKGTLDFGLKFLAQSPTNLYGFSNSNWVGCPTTWRNTIGYCIFLGENSISWSLKKQMIVAHSIVEVEYRFLASTIAKLTWITFLLRDIDIPLLKPP